MVTKVILRGYTELQRGHFLMTMMTKIVIIIIGSKIDQFIILGISLSFEVHLRVVGREQLASVELQLLHVKDSMKVS